ncbi:DUF5590 domain-containing protein [Bacillus sp. B15-48]|uniref:cell wall elongation regulator TseB-like domain-containing protein n=1 Tax=Bacillus sp. B15-48 TaxID=1548601 RepID=UPI0019400EF6|nr:DUF5590 domain-containing protein [Bacillus sp. B15-48]MBM4762094.1 peptidase [Bacillus sp. B15-48]
MKKWIVLLTIVLLAVASGFVALYYNATKPLREAEKIAIEIAQQDTTLIDIHEFDLFNGEETYYVLKAKNKNNEDVYVWISEIDHKMLIKTANSGVSEEEVVKTVYADRNPEEIIDVRLGITRIQKTNRPAWEVYFRSKNGNINYYYVDFETGEKLRAIDNF